MFFIQSSLKSYFYIFGKGGELVWSADYDIYGRLKNLKGERTFIPFRQVGQIEDSELEGLYYNRYRWYNSETGCYISQDPIGLAENNPAFPPPRFMGYSNINGKRL